ncbi:MAG TPA: acetate/propionate family kinase [Steroidobacteraceae bacterium]|nr:acetate/propionate family kinase [Steroidobacteraceae bacterium]
MPDALLVLNCGSSSLRFALLEQGGDGTFARRYRGEASSLGHAPHFTVHTTGTAAVTQRPLPHGGDDHAVALDAVLEWLQELPEAARLVAAGHRIVHGGTTQHAPALLDAALLAQLEALVPLAPLHQPQALAAVRRLAALRPGLPQLACFDTAFHRTMPWVEQRLALPAALHAQGVQRFGFHGLSCEFIAGELARLWGERARGRIVIAHLGQGSSLCALHGLQSQATTMGFTPLDGVPMATRCGAIDAAVPLYLLERGMDVTQVRALLHEASGLRGLSGSSGDMRTLLADAQPAARDAVRYYCHHVARALASMAAAIGGLDAIVFTGGIGQHAPAVRAAILEQSAWLGVRIDGQANANASVPHGAVCITTANSRVPAWVLATDEEAVIGAHTARALLDQRSAAAGAGD